MTKEKDPKEITDQDLDDVDGGRRSMEGGSAGGGSTGGVGDDDLKRVSGGRGSVAGGNAGGGGGGTSGVGDDDLKRMSGGRGGSDIKVKIQDADLEG